MGYVDDGEDISRRFDDRRDKSEKERRSDKMYIDIYEGRGKENPSIITRLTSLETGMESLENTIKKLVAGQDWGIRLLIGLLVAALINIAVAAHK